MCGREEVMHLRLFFSHVLKEKKRPVQGSKVSFLPLTGHTQSPARHKSVVIMPILFSVPK